MCPFFGPFWRRDLSVGDDAVHLIGQLFLELQWLPRLSSGQQFRRRVLHFVDGHVTSLCYLTLGEVHKLGVLGIQAEPLRQKDLTSRARASESH